MANSTKKASYLLDANPTILLLLTNFIVFVVWGSARSVLFWHSLFPIHPNYLVIDLKWIHLNPKVNWMVSGTYEQSVFIRQTYNKFWEMFNSRDRLWILNGTLGRS